MVRDLSRPPLSPGVAGRAILIGADCPAALDAEQLIRAGEALRTHDVVLGPARDGGYYLIGLRGPWKSHASRFESLFRDIPWSTDRVGDVTRAKLRSAGLAAFELAIQEDIDTIAELNRLRATLATANAQHLGLRDEIEAILTPPLGTAQSPP